MWRASSTGTRTPVMRNRERIIRMKRRKTRKTNMMLWWKEAKMAPNTQSTLELGTKTSFPQSLLCLWSLRSKMLYLSNKSRKELTLLIENKYSETKFRTTKLQLLFIDLTLRNQLKRNQTSQDLRVQNCHKSKYKMFQYLKSKHLRG